MKVELIQKTYLFLCFGYKTVFLIFQKQLWSFGIRGTSSLGLLSTYFPRTGAKRTHVLTFNQYISDVYVDVHIWQFFCYISTIIYKIQIHNNIQNTNTYQDLSHMHASLIFHIFNIHITYLSVERTFLTSTLVFFSKENKFSAFIIVN